MEDTPNGYPRLGALLASSGDFLVVRRFRYLQARTLLQIQDELRRYEIELDSIDNQLSGYGPDQESGRDNDLSIQRLALLGKIEARFQDYGSFHSLQPHC